VTDQFIETYKMEEIPDYRHVVHRRRDPTFTNLDDRSDSGTFSEKMMEVNMDTDKRLLKLRQVMQRFKARGKLRFVEWVSAPSLAQSLDKAVRGKQIKRLHSSKFCTGRHLQVYNEVVDLLGGDEIKSGSNSQYNSDDEEGMPKRRKLDNGSVRGGKPYKGTCESISLYKEDFKMLNKLTKVFSDIEDKTKVLFLTKSMKKRTNILTTEIKAENQIRLISTLITAITDLEKGEHLIVEGFPLFSRINVAIFLCIAALFEEIGFIRPYGDDDMIFMSNFLGSNAEATLSHLETILKELYDRSSGEQVLSAWSVKDLVQEPVYSQMLLYNQLKLKEKVLHLTDWIVEEEEKKKKEKEGSKEVTYS